jgi:AraC-like DNA-binding protein
MKLHVRHVVVCRFAQETAYTVPCPTVGFIFSGLEFSDSPQFRIPVHSTGIFLQPRGLPIHFRYNERRENYAILCDSEDLRLSSQPGRAEIRHSGEWLTIPLFMPVDKGRLESWRVELERIRTVFLLPTARNRLRAEMGVFNLFRCLIDEALPSARISPAERLKALIDADATGERSINEFGEECGSSPDHLRILFFTEFGITPKQYRIRRRLTEAMECIAGSRLSIKEIAVQLGFEQVSHFSAAFKAVHGLPPREALRRYRGTRDVSFQKAERFSRLGAGAANDVRAICPDLP